MVFRNNLMVKKNVGMYIWLGVCSLGRKYTSAHTNASLRSHNHSIKSFPSPPAPSYSMPSSTPNTQHPTPVQPPRGTAGGNDKANQTAYATRPYTNIVACNGTLTLASHITVMELTHHRLFRRTCILWPQDQTLEFHGGAGRAERGAGCESSLGDGWRILVESFGGDDVVFD